MLHLSEAARLACLREETGLEAHRSEAVERALFQAAAF